MTDMSRRSAGIGHIAARSLMEEVSALRDDIAMQSAAIAQFDAMMRLMYAELHRSNLARYLPPQED